MANRHHQETVDVMKMTRRRIMQQHHEGVPHLSTVKRRSRIQCWWFLALIAVATPVVKGSPLSEANLEAVPVEAPRSVPRLPLEPAPAPARFERLLKEDDKEKDNKNKGTPSPSFYPTPEPTAEPTTASPTQTPTTSPSAAPTDTMAPSPSPSEVPSQVEPTTPVPTADFPTFDPTGTFPFDEDAIVGYLEIAISVQPRFYKSVDIDNGEAPEVVEAVRDSIAEAICHGTDIQVIGYGGVSKCDVAKEEKMVRRLLSVHVLATVDPIGSGVSNSDDDDNESMVREDHVLIFAVDREQDGVSWILWKHLYPVMEIGSTFTTIDEEANDTISPTATVEYGEYLQEESGRNINNMLLMQTVAQRAVDSRMDEINEILANVDARASVVGFESTAFAPHKYDEPLDPHMLHGLRLAGIIMLGTTLLFACCLMRAAGARKREREWDKELQERGRGGLVTEEGLDYMLEVGRSKTTGTSPSSARSAPANESPKSETGASDSLGLPLPSQYMSVNIYSSFQSAETQQAAGTRASDTQSIEVSPGLVHRFNDAAASSVMTGYADHDFD